MDPRIIDLYNDYIHGKMPRRSFLKRVAEVAGGAAAAAAILPLIESNDAWGQQVDPADERLDLGHVEYAGTVGPVNAYFAKPANAEAALPGVLVIHENRGLNAHIEDVARRAALAGYVTIAPDGLSFVGGAPENQEAARDKFRAAAGKVGAVGFCYGGGVALRCAIADFASDASVLFYGRALTAEQVAQVRVPLMMNYAGNDPRVNAMIPDFRAALDKHAVAYSLHMYPGTGHGFHNDTSQARYNEAAAKLAWRRTLNFFDHYLVT
jgi:carboxymethylenebutenolidase